MSYYTEKQREGDDFADFLGAQLSKIGIKLRSYHTKSEQYNIGENRFGMEIKRSPVQGGTMNIELCEKSKPRPGDYAYSGILRDDNSWLYAIGNERRVWIFSVTMLRFLWSQRRVYSLIPYETPTSRGYLLPVRMADRLCALKIIFDEGEIVTVRNGSQRCDVSLSPEDNFLRSCIDKPQQR